MAIQEVKQSPLKIFYSGIHGCYIMRSEPSRIVVREFDHEADALMCSIVLQCAFYWNPFVDLKRIKDY